MQLIHDWLDGRNLPKPPTERLEGEALTYALVTLARGGHLPDEVVVALAENFLGQVVSPDTGTH